MTDTGKALVGTELSMEVGPGGAALYRTETTVDRKVSIFGSGGASTKTH